MMGLYTPMPCTRWKLPGYQNPKAELDHLRHICDNGEMRFPRYPLLPSLWRFCSFAKEYTNEAYCENKPGGSLRRCIRIPTAGQIHAFPIIPQLLFSVSRLVKKYSFFLLQTEYIAYASSPTR